MSDVETQFKAALSVIQSLPKNGSYKPSPDMMLHFYSLYKQATEGRCNRTKPWSFDIINKAKWDAWNKLGNMPREEAMKNYVVELTKVMKNFPRPSDDQIIEALPANDNAANFIETLGSFYEIVDPESENAREFKKFTDSRKQNGNHSISNGGPPVNGNSTSDTEESLNDDDDDHKHSSESKIEEESESEGDDSVENIETANKSSADVKDYSPSEDTITLQLNDSDDEFCDTSADITSLNSRHRDYSGSQSVSTMSSGSFGDTPPRGTDKLLPERSLPLNNQPRTRGGEKGTHGVDESVPFDQDEQAAQVSRVAAASRTNNFASSQIRSGSGGGGEDRNPPENNRQSEVQERIAVALLQLQRDMHSVLNRLTTLETITISRHQDVQHCHHCCKHGTEKKSSWWLFDDLSPKTTLFLLIWPFLARILVAMWTKRIRKRRS